MAVKVIEKPFFTASLICVFVFYFCMGRSKLPSPNPFYSLIPKEKISGVRGILISSPVKSQSGKTYSAKMHVQRVWGENLTSQAGGNITIFIPSEMVEVYFPGKIYSKAAKKGAFLYEAGCLYDFSGLFLDSAFFVKSCSSASWKNGFLGYFDYIRALSRLQFKRLMYSWKDGGGLLLALLSGSREYLDAGLYSDFRKAGLSHIIALSGMHLSMFSSIALFFGMKLGQKKIAFIIRLSALILFVWFAGFSPSLLRAFICAMLILFSAVCGEPSPDMLMVLSFSFLLQGIISPSDLQNAGFILSYAALAGILIFGKLFKRFFTPFLPFYFASSLSASCGAQLFTAPLSLRLFGFYSPVGLIATVFAAPLISVFIYTSLFLIILSLFFPLFASYSAFFVAIEYNLIKSVVRFFSCAPYWSIS